ncbi:polysaccharide deacetylase [Desulfuribacillus alkaliarsenatis]|uniref:Polysaccharide deacetylase n=2 Tax=Desulfuribacillus alkaliarsenatis TaxID=766136 RepID=A0A1E5G2I4_9FIRM|nr:polysaccharide deacetylase [Desulfuribacillus alkaliarsenatis]
MRDDNLLVPALFFKHTGTYVDWNEQYQSVVFRAKDKYFALLIGKNYTDDLNRATGQWTRGTLATHTLDFGGEPFVPLVDVARKLGMDVRYDQTLRRTFITTNLPVQRNQIIRARTNEKLVALTFDDGPDDHYTPMILDILKEKGVPATFFVVGQQINAHPDMMRRIVNEGHGIANHTWSHPNLRNQWSSAVRNEIVSTQQELQRVVGRRPDIFRAPYGITTKADIAILNELGMRNIFWSVDTLDWSGLSADEILKIVRRDISPGGIILQHNYNPHANILDGTVEALPRIIDELRAQGYRFVTVQTLLDSQQ